MNDIKKEFEEKFCSGIPLELADPNYIFQGGGLAISLWFWIEQKLAEAKIEVLRKVYVNIYTKDEIPNIISELEKK